MLLQFPSVSILYAQRSYLGRFLELKQRCRLVSMVVLHPFSSLCLGSGNSGKAERWGGRGVFVLPSRWLVPVPGSFPAGTSAPLRTGLLRQEGSDRAGCLSWASQAGENTAGGRLPPCASHPFPVAPAAALLMLTAFPLVVALPLPCCFPGVKVCWSQQPLQLQTILKSGGTWCKVTNFLAMAKAAFSIQIQIFRDQTSWLHVKCYGGGSRYSEKDVERADDMAIGKKPWSERELGALLVWWAILLLDLLWSRTLGLFLPSIKSDKCKIFWSWENGKSRSLPTVFEIDQQIWSWKGSSLISRGKLGAMLKQTFLYHRKFWVPIKSPGPATVLCMKSDRVSSVLGVRNLNEEHLNSKFTE